MKDKLYFDLSGGGITLSGGEPLYQFDFCRDLVSKSKSRGLHVVVDTSGYAESESLLKLMPIVDLFLYDIKFVNNALHKKYTGKSNTLILENFKRVCHVPSKIIVRIPLIPKITDTKKNLSQIKEFVNGCSEKIELNYIPFNKMIFDKYHMLGKECSLNFGYNEGG